jgi:hypothetical protein
MKRYFWGSRTGPPEVCDEHQNCQLLVSWPIRFFEPPTLVSGRYETGNLWPLAQVRLWASGAEKELRIHCFVAYTPNQAPPHHQNQKNTTTLASVSFPIIPKKISPRFT